MVSRTSRAGTDRKRLKATERSGAVGVGIQPGSVIGGAKSAGACDERWRGAQWPAVLFTRRAVEWSRLNRTESGGFPARQSAAFQQSKAAVKNRCLPLLSKE